MELKDIIEKLKIIRNHPDRTPEEIQAIDCAISNLKKDSTKEHLMIAVKLLMELINIGTKFFN